MPDIDLSLLTPRTQVAADSDVVMSEGVPDTMNLVNARLSVKFANTTLPAAPATDQATIYRHAIAKMPLVGTIGPDNEHLPLQHHMMRSGLGFWIPPGTAATLPAIIGYPLPTTTGFTATARVPLATNYFTRRMRLGYVSAATAAAVGHFRAAGQMFTIGSGAGVGGFKHMIRFGISDAAAVAGARMFLGVSAGGVPTNVEPSTLVNCIGIGHGAADTNMKIFYGGSAAQTPIDLGASFPSNTRSVDAYELTLFAPANSQVIHYEVTCLNTGAVATGTLSGTVGTQLPAAATFLGPWGYRTNNATALAVALDIFRASIEICDE